MTVNSSLSLEGRIIPGLFLLSTEEKSEDKNLENPGYVKSRYVALTPTGRLQGLDCPRRGELTFSNKILC